MCSVPRQLSPMRLTTVRGWGASQTEQEVAQELLPYSDFDNVNHHIMKWFYVQRVRCVHHWGRIVAPVSHVPHLHPLLHAMCFNSYA